MASRGLRQWTVQFAETEPDLAAFVDRYVEKLERHPITGGFRPLAQPARTLGLVGPRWAIRRANYR